MIIGVAGPYSAPTAELKAQNLLAMNKAAAELLKLGHVPVIGMNAALPVVEAAGMDAPYEAIMKISMAVIGACEGILMIGSSPGANKEKELVQSKGLPVYNSIEEVPPAE